MNVAITVDRTSSGKEHFEVLDGLRGTAAFLINIARMKGVSAFVGDGANRWAAVHGLDAARLYREMAEAIGRGLRLPTLSLSAERAGEHFGVLGLFAGLDLVGSSALTQQWLDWRPTQPGLMDDLNHARDFESENVKINAGRKATSKWPTVDPRFTGPI
jgi:hypothetical protein